MSRNSKRKLEDFDPTKSDSDDGDYANVLRSESGRGPRSKAKSTTHSRKPAKRKRRSYNEESDDEIIDDEDDESANSSESDFAEHRENDEEEPVRNSVTGRVSRAVARKPIVYEENSSNEDEQMPDEDVHKETKKDKDDEQVTPRKNNSKSKRSLVIKLHMSPQKLSLASQASPKKQQTSSKTVQSHDNSPIRTRRGSRRSGDSVDDQNMVEAVGSDIEVAQVIPKRATRGGKGVKKPLSTVDETLLATGVDLNNMDELQIPTSDVHISQNEPLSPNAAAAIEIDEGETGDIVPASDVEAESPIKEAKKAVKDNDDEEEDDDDDDGPIIRRSSRAVRSVIEEPQDQSPQPFRRTLRQRKPAKDQSSDFEPEIAIDVEHDENVSDDASGRSVRPPRRDAEIAVGQGRKGGRLTSKRDRATSEFGGSEIDPDEIADELASLEDDQRRIRRSRRGGRRQEKISYEPNLRNRSNRPDYRLFRPELVAQMDDDNDDASAMPTASQARGKKSFRSLFSIAGPFGGANGASHLFGGPAVGAVAGGVDSDSSDDDFAKRPVQGVGGAVGMTPTQAQTPFGLVPQVHNTDVGQGGGGGGPANFGKVNNKKALADADPLGVDPNVNFDGVGGLSEHIDRLKEMVALPLLYPEVFLRMHVTPPRGVLFHGPPGTGKTLLARALASSVSSHGKKVTFYMRKGADALSKWVGEAERQLRLLFEEARKNQPSIIFFDEIDGLAPVRSSKQEQIHASIVATLLALMDGMDGRGQVIVIGATNRPDSVDPALRRPGRFDREFYFPLPNKEARKAILQIHTKGWEPPLRPEFLNQLAELTKGYGGADLRALCTEAALNAVQGTFPQIYKSNKKLIIDPEKIQVSAKDFMISVSKIIPSSERSASSGSAPLNKAVEPLLRNSLEQIEATITTMLPKTNKRTALEEAEYDDRDDALGFEKENLRREFESVRVFRPRLLIGGMHGMGQSHIGPAILNKFETMYVANFDLPNMFKDSTRSPEAAIVQMFEEVKRHKPSVIYIPNVNIWYRSLSESAIRTFTGLIGSLPATDPVLVLGVMESRSHADEIDEAMRRELFGYSSDNLYILRAPDEASRRIYFTPILDYIRRSPSEFPDPENRKKRVLEILPEAPAIVEPPRVLTKADLKAQAKQDRYTLNSLRLHIQAVMDLIRAKYRKFRSPPIDEKAFAYLLAERDPDILTTDLNDEAAGLHMNRPYKLAKDKKGVDGLLEVSSDKFYYNLELGTIEQRLAHGCYMRPKDFLADVGRLQKDAETMGDQDRLLKARELYNTVDVDMNMLEKTYPALIAECGVIYQREKAKLASQKVDNVPQVSTIIANKPTHVIEQDDDFVLGSDVIINEGMIQNGQSAQPKPNQVLPENILDAGHVDTEMLDGSDGIDCIDEHTQLRAGPVTAGSSLHQSELPVEIINSDGLNQAPRIPSQPPQWQQSNSIHTTTTRQSNGVSSNSDAPDFGILDPVSGSQLPDTQVSNSQITSYSPEVRNQYRYQNNVQLNTLSSPSHAESRKETGHVNLDKISNQAQPADSDPNRNRIVTSNSINHENHNEPLDKETMPAPQLIPISHATITALTNALARGTSGLSVEQLEQVMASLMKAIWSSRGEWNRNKVAEKVTQAFNYIVLDIEKTQGVGRASQEDSEYSSVCRAERSGGQDLLQIRSIID